MRILMVNPHFSPINSGSGSVTLRLAQGLQARGSRVVVLTVGMGLSAATDDEIEGLPIRRLPARALSLGPLALKYRLPFALRRGVSKNIGAIFEREAPDVVHLHGQFWDLNILCAREARRRSIPVVLSVHTAIVNPNRALNSLVAFIDRHLIRRLIAPKVDVWTGYDRRVLDYIATRYGIDGPVFLPNPVESISLGDARPERAKRELGSRDGPIVLSVGHVIPQLRDRLSLVRAFAILRREWPDARLVVAGRLYDTRFLALAEQLEIRDSVVALGEVPHEDIPDWLAAADVECHDLAGVGIGVATIEAMMAGVPVVMVLRQGDIPEVDLGDHGSLARLESDVPQLVADRIASLLASDTVRRSVAEAGRAFATRLFDVQKVSRRAELLYEGVLRDT